ncbi:hypothetical protein M1N11_05015, partial [Peptococcaceae bacterium]|nr:hypothetical protein [Peptococcaceae bacterium]
AKVSAFYTCSHAGVFFAAVLKPSFAAVLTVWILCLCGPHSSFSVSYNGIFFCIHSFHMLLAENELMSGLL